MANEIVIVRGNTSVVMPRVRNVIVGGKEEAKTITMASGKHVKEVLGFRVTVTAAWDWVPAQTLTALAALLRQGGFFQVRYPTPEGEKAGAFSISYPEMRIFTFRRQEPVWHDVKLVMEAQEVI